MLISLLTVDGVVYITFLFGSEAEGMVDPNSGFDLDEAADTLYG